jgi:hypothetical protein
LAGHEWEIFTFFGKDLAVVAENPGECLESKESNVGAFTLSD